MKKILTWREPAKKPRGQKAEVRYQPEKTMVDWDALAEERKERAAIQDRARETED